MTRPLTNTVEYFMHTTSHGKTLFILEQRFGNDGYAFWYKLLETLGRTENHFLDITDPLVFETLQARARINDTITTLNLLELLALLQAINPELWKFGLVWSDNFVKGLEPVYKNRKRELPPKPITTGRKEVIINRNPLDVGITTSNLPVVNPLGSIGSYIGIKGSKEADEVEKPEEPAKPKPKSTFGLAVDTYRDILKLTPNQDQRDLITNTVGARVEEWSAVLTYWKTNNYSPKNISGMLKRFEEQNGKKPAHRSDIQNSGDAWEAEIAKGANS